MGALQADRRGAQVAAKTPRGTGETLQWAGQLTGTDPGHQQRGNQCQDTDDGKAHPGAQAPAAIRRGERQPALVGQLHDQFVVRVGVVGRPVGGLVDFQPQRNSGQQLRQSRHRLRGYLFTRTGQGEGVTLGAPLHMQHRVARRVCQLHALVGWRGFQYPCGDGDLFKQAGFLQRRSRPDPGQLHEQDVQRHRDQHGGNDGQCDAPADAVVVQAQADHVRLTLASNR
ncbi:hypothetical protein D3C79_665780 [compost metagenome]